MKKLNNKGFTLIEMVIVIVIIAILAAMLVPSLLAYVDNANRKSFLSACDTIKTNALSVSSEKYAAGGSSTLGASDSSAINTKLGDSASVSIKTTEADAATVVASGTKNNYYIWFSSDMGTMRVANGSYYGLFSGGQWTVYDKDGATD